jgi:hypothetical protein
LLFKKADAVTCHSIRFFEQQLFIPREKVSITLAVTFVKPIGNLLYKG